ncbi:MAG TPA: indole-3-glycerol phosphate synthase TrpC [Thermodesulfobacteriota bacterium]|nr:indole-3-glycerol phosphate synthase TrpC [Thermodesulfobacteriota bacterium]
MMLDEIVAAKKEALEHIKKYTTVDKLKQRIGTEFRSPKDLATALAPRDGAGAVRIIAEIKRASPTQGVIKHDFMPAEIARIYEANGAAAISILTEEKYFKGNIEYLAAIRRNLKIPALRKDFIFDEYQVYESRVYGADAILLIAAILDQSLLVDLAALAGELGMSVLLEVHDEKELERALDVDVKVIGINNRDLKTFKTDLNTTVRLIPYVPKDRVLVSESGINSFEDILMLRSHGVDAFLIGEALMKEDNMHIGRKLKELRGIK